MQISIIVPVYNVEDYLKESINSVLTQTYQSIEVLLIDDGSTDQSPVICDYLSEKDNRVKVIHQKNGGLSNARNTGIKNARGDYLMFLDSDDFWENRDALNGLLAKVDSDNEVICFHYKKFYESSGLFQTVSENVDESKINTCAADERKYLGVKYHQFFASACNKLIKREFIFDHSIFFNENIIAEDVDWCARILLYAKNISFYNDDFYIYRQREMSLTHNVQLKNLHDVTENIIRCLKYYSDFKGISNYSKLAYLNYVSYVYGTFFATYHMVDDKNKKELLNKMKNYRFLLNFHLDKKVKMLYLLDKYLGYYNMARIMKIYTLLRK